MALKKLNRTELQLQPFKDNKMLVFGGGNFVRAFILFFLNEFNKNSDDAFGATVVKVTPGEYKDWKEQDGLYHVLTKGLAHGNVVEKCDLISSVVNLLSIYDEWESFIEMAHDPQIEFLVNNVTESGLKFEEEPYELEIPIQFPGKITKWLYARFLFFNGDTTKGCFIIPCELVENNATVLKNLILRYVDQWHLSLDFKLWLEESCNFCNTLVDRIVPGVSQQHLASAKALVGYDDNLITEGEPYHLFVIEDNGKLASALPWHKTPNLNIIYTPDLSEYRIRKIRILNGAHSSMVPVGLLYGLETVKQVMNDKTMTQYVDHLIFKEIIACLPLPLEQLLEYAKDTLDRFRNPFLHHKLITISLNSFSKARARIVPTIKETYARTGVLARGTCLALASTIVLYRGQYKGMSFEIKDERNVIETLKSFWGKHPDGLCPSEAEVAAILNNQQLWGEDLTLIPGLIKFITTLISSILTTGIKEEIAKII